MSYTVYKHITPNGKIYIGITKRNPLKRWQNGRGYSTNKHFSRAIKKYGWNNMIHEILFSGLSEDEAKIKEIKLIAYYKSNNPKYGYNITSGGDYRAKLSKESIAKLKTKLTGQKRTKEQRLHYKEAALRRPKRKLSALHKKHISETLIGNKRAAGSKSNMIQVSQFTLAGKFMRSFECAKKAALFIGCSTSGINCCCREQLEKDLSKTKYKGKYKGYIWKYIGTSTFKKTAAKLANSLIK